jgi:23S rRNA pseudouridine1911/1915/1917 synthase
MDLDGTTPLEFIVSAGEADLRLEHFVRRRVAGISRGSVQRLLERRLVLVDGRGALKGLRLRPGQQVVVAAAARSERPLPQPDLDLDVLVVRPELVAIDKPAGRACHPLVPGETDTVANALVARFPECAAASPFLREAGLVHRLDWSTSGVLLAARDPQSYGRLRGQFSGGQVIKHYLAIVVGEARAGRVEASLRTVPGDPRRMEVAPAERQVEGQRAETEFEPLQHSAGYTLLHLRCRTGRRHQVRVHMAHLGHPLLNDRVYGGPSFPGTPGAFLHASRVVLLGDALTFDAPLGADRQQVLRALGFAQT